MSQEEGSRGLGGRGDTGSVKGNTDNSPSPEWSQIAEWEPYAVVMFPYFPFCTATLLHQRIHGGMDTKLGG